MGHSLRCYLAGLTIPAVFGPPRNVQPRLVPGGVTQTIVYATRRDIGLVVTCSSGDPTLGSSTGTFSVTQHWLGAPDHPYHLPAGTHVIVFGRDGDRLTITSPSGSSGVSFWPVSIDGLKQDPEE